MIYKCTLFFKVGPRGDGNPAQGLHPYTFEAFHFLNASSRGPELFHNSRLQRTSLGIILEADRSSNSNCLAQTQDAATIFGAPSGSRHPEQETLWLTMRIDETAAHGGCDVFPLRFRISVRSFSPIVAHRHSASTSPLGLDADYLLSCSAFSGINSLIPHMGMIYRDNPCLDFRR
jgi:hypothetical protein